MASPFQKRGWTINAPDVKVNPLSSSDKMQYLFHTSAAQTAGQFADLARENQRNHNIALGRSPYEQYSPVAASSSIASSRARRSADKIAETHIDKQLKKKNFNRGSYGVYHTAFSHSAAVKYQARGKKRKAYVRGLGV